MDNNIDTRSNLMDISEQQIKNEPSDEANVEEVNIGELFENDLPSFNKFINVPLSQTKIVREDAGPEEIVKEEPRFEYDDELEVQGTGSPSSASYKHSSKLMACSTELNYYQKDVKTNETALQPKKRVNSAVLNQSSSKCRKQGSKERIQNKSGKNGDRAKCSENHHQNNAASVTKAQSRQSNKTKLLKNPTFECFLCKITVSSASNLKRHYDRFHGEKSFRCNLCSKRFSVKFSLDIHKRSHSGAKPFQCEICQRKFATQNNLRRHNESCGPMNVVQKKLPKAKVVTKESQSFQCYLCKCGDDLKIVQDLQVHMIKHTGRNVLPCNVCRRIFSTQFELVKHMLNHTKVKPFACDTCQMQFTTKRNLKRHKRLHTRVGLFKCNECNKEYTTKFARDAHQRKHLDPF